MGNYAEIAIASIINDAVVPGSFFMMGGWILGLKGTKPVITDFPHAHDYDEILGFTGSNVSNLEELGGEIEFWLEDEQYILTKSCLIFIPRGMKHGPLSVRRFERPWFAYTAALNGAYARSWEEDPAVSLGDQPAEGR